MKTSSIAWLFLAAWVVLVAPAPAHAQGSPTGHLTGTVTDPSGAVLPGVTVVAKGAETGLTQQTVSSGAGDWRIAALPTGTYEVTFELDGFKRLVRTGITVEAAVHAIGSRDAHGRRADGSRAGDRRRRAAERQHARRPRAA